MVTFGAPHPTPLAPSIMRRLLRLRRKRGRGPRRANHEPRNAERGGPRSEGRWVWALWGSQPIQPTAIRRSTQHRAVGEGGRNGARMQH